MRAIIWRLLNRPASATELAHCLGWGVSAGLFVWSIIPIAQRARLSLETAAATFILFAMVVISLAVHHKWKWNRAKLRTRFSLPSKAVRSSVVFLFLLPLVAVTVIMIPINDGLEAPGFTASVEPMVHMPAQYRHPSAGSLILTSVIPQAPILVGESIYAQLDHAVVIEPESQIVPPNTNAQTVSVQNYQMLSNSDTTAIFTGLHLAGYQVDINDGLIIGAIQPQSQAVGVLQQVILLLGPMGSQSSPRWILSINYN